MWSVPADQRDTSGHIYFEDDFKDTGATILDAGPEVPTGAAPTVYVGQLEDNFGELWEAFLVAGHAVTGIEEVYLNGLKVDKAKFGDLWCVPGWPGFATYFPNTGFPQYRDINGRRYTLLYVRGADGASAAGGEPVTVNLKGIEDVGDGSGALIEELVLQYKHFLVNFGFQDYQSGGWLSPPTWAPLDPGLTQIDDAAFEAVRQLTLTLVPGTGYVGGGIIGAHDIQTLREWIARWNVSCGVQSYFSRNHQFAIAMFNENTNLASTKQVTQTDDILAGTFQISPQRDRWFTELQFNYSYQWVREFWKKPQQSVVDTAAETNYLQKQVAPIRDLWFVRDETTALSIMNRLLARRKQVPMNVSFTVHAGLLDIELGTIIRVTHLEGVGPGLAGWVDRAVFVTRHELLPDNFTVRIEGEDVDELMP